MGNLQSSVGQVEFLTIRECAEALGIHAQTLKNWLDGDTHGAATLLEPVRVGIKYGMLIIPCGRFRRFQRQSWPVVRKAMESRGWKPRAAAK